MTSHNICYVDSLERPSISLSVSSVMLPPDSPEDLERQLERDAGGEALCEGVGSLSPGETARFPRKIHRRRTFNLNADDAYSPVDRFGYYAGSGRAAPTSDWDNNLIEVRHYGRLSLGGVQSRRGLSVWPARRHDVSAAVGRTPAWLPPRPLR